MLLINLVFFFIVFFNYLETKFLQEKYHKLRLQPSDEDAIFMNFGLSIKLLDQHRSCFIGFSRISLQKVIGLKEILRKRCPIIGSKGNIVGTILVEMQFGYYKRNPDGGKV